MADPVTVTLEREEWQALLNVVPMSQETYSDYGLKLFAAYQAIEHALDPDKPDQVAS